MVNLFNAGTKAIKAGKKAIKAARVITSLASTVAPVTDMAKGMAKDHRDQHKDDIKIPSMIGLSLDDAQKILTTFSFKSLNILTEPNKHFAYKRPNTIIRTEPKTGSKVPPNTFFKLFYADAAVIARSQELLKQANDRKAEKKTAHKVLAHKLLNSSKREVNGLSHKLNSTLHRVAKHTKVHKKED